MYIYEYEIKRIAVSYKPSQNEMKIYFERQKLLKELTVMKTIKIKKD